MTLSPGDRVRVINPGYEHGTIGRALLDVVTIDPKSDPAWTMAECVVAGTKMGPFWLFERELERVAEVQEVS